MTTGSPIPSWVQDFEEEYYKFSRKYNFIKLTGLILAIISFVALSSNEIKNNDILKNISMIIFFVSFFIIAVYINKKPPSTSKYLASMIYSIGLNLERNSDTESKIYISKMDKYLKICDNIMDNIRSSLYEAIYVNSTLDFLKKLNKAIRLLNEYYINYQQYDIDKLKVSDNIIKLAEIIHDDKGYVTPAHLKAVDALVDDLTGANVKVKPIREKFTLKFKTVIGGLPYNVKLICYIIIVIFLTYQIIINLALKYGNTQDKALEIAIYGSLAALVPALMIKDYILKEHH